MLDYFSDIFYYKITVIVWHL